MVHPMARRLLLSTWLLVAGVAALTMFPLACQPITEEPDAGAPVNHPPRIVEGGESPKSALVYGVQTSSSTVSSGDCANGISFSVGTVEDDDLDQEVHERWIVDYDPNNPELGEEVVLQPVQDQPAFRTDPPNAFFLSKAALESFGQTGPGTPPNLPHTVDVFVSDGFDTTGSPGKPLKPTDVLSGFYLVRHTWVIYMEGTCPSN